jgi:hypothetical protein
MTDFNFFESCTKEFFSSILSIEKCMANNGPIKENTLNFFFEKYKYFIGKIKQLLNIETIDIISPLYKQMKEVLSSYTKIKNDLFEGKLKLNNAKKDYIKIIKEDNKAKEQKKILKK